MAFTQADADAIRAHLVARLSGSTAKRVRFADREVELDSVDDARELLAEIEASISSQRTRFASYDKGLCP